ncbi:hypothetical protein SynPROS91_00638 [Synechococcus sp. PROS-9-1]|nr:hypothetical protein SynPROS91_00638 [Synechococcus sp. PROS-9-1]
MELAWRNLDCHINKFLHLAKAFQFFFKELAIISVFEQNLCFKLNIAIVILANIFVACIAPYPFYHPPHSAIVNPHCCQLWCTLFEDVELAFKVFAFENFAN